MDLEESAKVVYSRIQKLEPENFSKIFYYLVERELSELDMIRLAFCPDTFVLNLINKAKSGLGLSNQAVCAPISTSQVSSAPRLDVPSGFTPRSTYLISSPSSLPSPNTYWNSHVPGDQQQLANLDYVPQAYWGSMTEDSYLQNQMQFLTLEDQVDSNLPSNYVYPEPPISVRSNRRSPSLPEFPVKICHYFTKGYCKHGNNCRHFHGMPENDFQVFVPSSNVSIIGDHRFSPRSLELELVELLKSRRGIPVSIASLPELYYERFGRTLQAEGYETESQRHGKAAYSLTKLLAEMKNTIRLIDRPHGQHSVILAEDFQKYLEYAGVRSDLGGIVPGSQQIYLTFPAESTFTEQDVFNYFNNFGPVQDVRIPLQQKRMFGFVTFVYCETVKQVLAKGNPHYICGSRILVKPYREKPKSMDRKMNGKYAERIQNRLSYNHHFLVDADIHSVPSLYDNSRPLRKDMIEAHELGLRVERWPLSESHRSELPKPLTWSPYYVTEAAVQTEHEDLPSAENFSYFTEALNNGSTSNNRLMQLNNYNDQDSSSQGPNLPESPFASPVRHGITSAT